MYVTLFFHLHSSYFIYIYLVYVLILFLFLILIYSDLTITANRQQKCILTIDTTPETQVCYICFHLFFIQFHYFVLHFFFIYLLYTFLFANFNASGGDISSTRAREVQSTREAIRLRIEPCQINRCPNEGMPLFITRSLFLLLSSLLFFSCSLPSRYLLKLLSERSRESIK